MTRDPDRSSRSRWWSEPLVHFVLLGAALFALEANLSERTVEAEEGSVVITAGRVENLAALFAKTWQRPPTASELKGLVDDYVLEEILYREGLALGVHRDDTVIRRRVRQKMEFVTDDLVERAEPSDRELEEWLAEHADDYARPARYSFRQVYLSTDRGETLFEDAESLLARLRAGTGASPEESGDRTLLEHAYASYGAYELERNFGPEFADALAAQPLGEWSGPVESPYGLHLTIVDQRVEGDVPALDEIRAAVERDWSYEQRNDASTRFYAELVSRYDVRVEWPEALTPQEGQEREASAAQPR